MSLKNKKFASKNADKCTNLSIARELNCLLYIINTICIHMKIFLHNRYDDLKPYNKKRYLLSDAGFKNIGNLKRFMTIQSGFKIYTKILLTVHSVG